MKVLELFAGSRSFCKVAEELGHTTFSTDIEAFENIDLVKDIRTIVPNDIPFVPDVIWASPPCTYFSVASIGKHWHKDHWPKTEQAWLGIELVECTRDVIRWFYAINPNLKWFIENPRGKLRKLEVVKYLYRDTVCYCQYGEDRMKPTDIWHNSNWIPRPMCYNGNLNCHHQPAPRGSQTGTQGMKNAYEKSKVPSELVREILLAVDIN